MSTVLYHELCHAPLFRGIDEHEVRTYLSLSRVQCYHRHSMIFAQEQVPEQLYMLVSGTVVVGHDTSDGRRTVVATIDRAGDLFGEVFLFLSKPHYEHHAQAQNETRILVMPRELLDSGAHPKLTANMLTILANKAYYLNRRLQVLSCATLRQKIAMLLLQTTASGEGKGVCLRREALADFISAARPSVSRELMNMKREGLIALEGKCIRVVDDERLAQLL